MKWTKDQIYPIDLCIKLLRVFYIKIPMLVLFTNQIFESMEEFDKS